MLNCIKPLLVTSLLLFSATVFAAEKAEPDTRLATKVTVDCVGGRLHDALDQISAQTKVVIRTGTSKEDWKVRDIPVLVCAQDIPLGNLLKGVADATHLLWSRSKLDDEITYRVWRDLKRQKELDAFEVAKKDALDAAVSYDWDMLSQLSDETKAAKRKWPDHITAVAALITELGPEAKDKVLSGETILLTWQDASASLRPHFEYVFRGMSATCAKDRAVVINEQMLKKCYVSIKVENDALGGRELGVELYSKDIGGVTRIASFDYQLAMRLDDPSIPARPKVTKTELKSDDLDSRYTRLMEGEAPAFLDTKVKIEAPKDKKKPTYSDLLSGVSKAIGYSIVAEGRAARWVQIPADREKLVSMFGREIPVREVLSFAESWNNQEWYLDEQSKLILGRDKQWDKHARALVPEKLLIDMQKKLNGPGVELDDLEPFIGLSKEQIYEWIGSCPDEYPDVADLYGPANYVSEAFVGRLYFALNAQGRTIAKSGKPAPLLGVDRTWMARIIRTHVTRRTEMAMSEMLPSADFSGKFTDPDMLEGLRIRVTTMRLPKPYDDRHQYGFVVEGPSGSDINIPADMLGMFPIRAPKPKAEPGT